MNAGRSGSIIYYIYEYVGIQSYNNKRLFICVQMNKQSNDIILS